MIALETKLNVIKDYRGRKLVVATACQAGGSHSIVALILKKKDKGMGACKASAALVAVRLTEILEVPGSDLEELLMACVENQTQESTPLCTVKVMAKAESLFATLRERTGPKYDVELTDGSVRFKQFKSLCSLRNMRER